MALMVVKKVDLKEPQVVKVGPFLYSIFFDKEKLKQATLDHGSSVSGYCRKDKLEIIIDPDLDIQVKRETLWHEIKHACFAWVAISIDSPTEEQIVCLTAPLELSVLRENKDLVEYLTVA